MIDNALSVQHMNVTYMLLGSSPVLKDVRIPRRIWTVLTSTSLPRRPGPQVIGLTGNGCANYAWRMRLPRYQGDQRAP